jgi:hypothetical protein
MTVTVTFGGKWPEIFRAIWRECEPVSLPVEPKHGGWHMCMLVGTKIADEASERKAGSVPPAQPIRVVEVPAPTTVPFLPW